MIIIKTPTIKIIALIIITIIPPKIIEIINKNNNIRDQIKRLTITRAIGKT